jgi:phosphopantothenoylcysteine decarboxylase
MIRAWDTSRTIIAAPAMNQLTWEQPATAKQVPILTEEWKWLDILFLQITTEAGGDLGEQAMHDWTEIVTVIALELYSRLEEKQDIQTV